MFRFGEQFTKYVARPIAAIFARQVLTEAEVTTAINRAHALRSAYEQADAFGADGFPNLASELRDSADAIALHPPGTCSVEYFESLVNDEKSEYLTANAAKQPRAKLNAPDKPSGTAGKGRRRSKGSSGESTN